MQRYAASTQAYSDGQYRALLADCGYKDVTMVPSLEGPSGAPQPALMVLLARAGEEG